MSEPLMIDAWLTGQAHREAFEDMSAAQINALPVSQYARLTGREFPITAPTAPTPTPAPAGQDPAGVMAAQHPQHATEDPGVDFQAITMDEYSQIRDQLGIGVGREEGVGIFDSVSSRSQAYRNAARAQSGRTAYSNGNVTEAPKLTGRQERQGDRLDSRPARDRLSNPSNMWQR